MSEDDVAAALDAAEDVPPLPDGAGMPPAPPPADPPEGDLPPEARAAGLPLNDYGNGQRFVIYCGDDLLYVPRVGWFAWSGQRWRIDRDTIDVRRAAQTVSGKILAEVGHLWREASPGDAALIREADAAAADLARLEAAGEIAPGSTAEIEQKRLQRAIKDAAPARDRLSKARAEHRRHARSTGNKARIDAILTESVPMLARDLEDLDADPLAVNALSGVLRFDVTEGGEGSSRVARVHLDPHERADLLTKIMPVEYRPDAARPRFDAFLERVQPDPEMRAFIQRWLGLSMTGLLHQQLCFWHGGGANGKSVLIDVMARLMGDYSATAKIETLTGRNRRSGGDATPDLVPLIGARMVRASEPEEGERLQEGKIKELTGGEPILVRALNEDFVEVQPRFKLTISGNHKPEIRGDDDGIWRRLLLVPWDVTIPEGERDPILPERLWEERDGIFAWLVEGLLDFLEGGLAPPEIVTAATRDYRRESDPVGQFLSDCAIFTGDPGDTILSDDLCKRFAYWLLENGQGVWRPRTIANKMSAKADVWRHPHGGGTMSKGKSSRATYIGVRMVDAFNRRFDLAPKDSTGNALRPPEEVSS